MVLQIVTYLKSRSNALKVQLVNVYQGRPASFYQLTMTANIIGFLTGLLAHLDILNAVQELQSHPSSHLPIKDGGFHD